ncbi:tetratricopeptide repeat protein [Wielerella bovis]|uniref:tetratricopeptide repeat protein n=1 Tax=Wielerella bovis TaxID=2917790 RepID=UPI0020192EDA|nr:hypothetical protein [Wielerella bovis]ULJ61202.1 hypothetical protein MIS44_04965 [Wielerella bovis]
MNNPYINFKRHHSDILMVVFGAAGKSGEFTFYKTMQSVNANVLSIAHDGQNAWYKNGVPTLGNSLTELMENTVILVKQCCLKYNIKQVILVGASMGGYAALLFGCFMRNTFSANSIKVKTLVFGAETVLFLVGSNSLKHNPHETKDDFPKEFLDITPYKNHSDEIYMLFGENFLPDAYSALLYKEKQEKFHQKHINLLSIYDCAHMVPVYINRDSGLIVDFFNNFINDEIFIFHQGHMASYLTSDDLLPLFNLDLNADSTLDYLIALTTKYSAYVYGLNRLGIWYETHGDLENALKYLKLAHFIDPSLNNTIEHLGNVRRRLQQHIGSMK